MTDIVHTAQESSAIALWQAYCEKKMALEDAADEIERLRAALRRIGNPGEDVDCSKEGHTVAVLVARAALGENSHD